MRSEGCHSAGMSFLREAKTITAAGLDNDPAMVCNSGTVRLSTVVAVSMRDKIRVLDQARNGFLTTGINALNDKK